MLGQEIDRRRGVVHLIYESYRDRAGRKLTRINESISGFECCAAPTRVRYLGLVMAGKLIRLWLGIRRRAEELVGDRREQAGCSAGFGLRGVA